VGRLFQAWISGPKELRFALVVSMIFFIAGWGVVILGNSGVVPLEVSKSVGLGFILAGIFITAGVTGYMDYANDQARAQKLQVVEDRLQAHPEKPQLAWDLARTKLEEYLRKNIAQVDAIFWLTLVVMLFGFCFITYGLYHATQNADKLPVSLVASASGVLISFIGGSFLLIYRSTLAQAKDYVSVLERINAVGMALQVIESIPQSKSELKDQTTAELAGQLLNLYASKPALKAKRSSKAA
jgi:hypothetical protein